MRALQRFCSDCEVGKPLDAEKKDRPAAKYVRECIVVVFELRVKLLGDVVFGNTCGRSKTYLYSHLKRSHFTIHFAVLSCATNMMKWRCC